MAPNPRVVNAFRAMRNLGIPEEKTKPVLKKLLRIFEKNWEPIEAENYRALADAIFESEESEAAEHTINLDNAEVAAQKKTLEQNEQMIVIEEETQIQEESERPLKRLCSSNQDDHQASPSSINPNPNSNSNGTLLKKPKLEVVIEPDASNDSEPVSPLKRVKNKGKQPISPNGNDASQSRNVEQTYTVDVDSSDSDSVILPRCLKDKGKEPLSPQNVAQEKKPISDKSSSALCLKDPKVEFGVGVVLEKKSLDSVKPKDKFPSAVIMQESFFNGEPDLSKGVQETSNVTITKLDIASSSNGEIKISLSCNSAHGNPILSFTSVETVLKTMEDNCPKSYKVNNPNFSVKKLMDDICECFLDLESNSTNVNNDSFKTCKVNGSVNISPPQIPKQPSPSNSNDNDLENTNSLDDVIDMAKGQESVIISLVNEVNTEPLPSFHYIPRNAAFQNAYINVSLSQISNDNCCPNCSNNCLESPTPCSCALQSGGKFAYTTKGLIKESILDEFIKTKRDPQQHCLVYCKECPLEKPCKGHIKRSFVKECWLKCGCNKKCGNRVVQCGVTHKLQVFMTKEGKGWGLRTLEDLPKGTFVCEFVGEVLTSKELCERDEYAHSLLLDADWGSKSELKDEEALCLDATYYGNVARFINHRCFDSNLIDIPVEVENPDHHYYHLAFFTTRKVKALEELTLDYGIDFDDDDYFVKAFKCQCGSQFCRNI